MDAKKPNDVDRYIAQKIRHYRRAVGLSQERLGKDLGVSFQQVQKYENATNRVSAAALFSIAQILGTDVRAFYPGADLDHIDPEITDALHRLTQTLRQDDTQRRAATDKRPEFLETHQSTD